MSSAVPAAPAAHAVGVEEVPDPQVPERASRRTYTAKYKLKVLAEYEAADRAGKGALLRPEWRKQRDRGALAALSTPRGPKPAGPARGERERLAVKNARLQDELDTARKVIRVQGELSALLEQLSQQSAGNTESEPPR